MLLMPLHNLGSQSGVQLQPFAANNRLCNPQTHSIYGNYLPLKSRPKASQLKQGTCNVHTAASNVELPAKVKGAVGAHDRGLPR